MRDEGAWSRFLWWFIDRLPLEIIRRSTIRGWTLASTGRFSHKEAGAITAFDVIEALENGPTTLKDES